MSTFIAPPPPPTATSLQGMPHHPPYTTHGSIGAVIGVLAVVLVLGAVAVFVGRLCSGRPIMGQTRAHYDMESWVESKCSSCVDGHLFHPPPPPPLHQHQPPLQQHQQHQQQQQQQQQQETNDSNNGESTEEIPPQNNNNNNSNNNNVGGSSS